MKYHTATPPSQTLSEGMPTGRTVDLFLGQPPKLTLLFCRTTLSGSPLIWNCDCDPLQPVGKTFPVTNGDAMTWTPKALVI